MNTSTWLRDISIPKAYPKLSSDISTECVIIGGGLAGTFTAYLLGKAGKKVILIEKKDISNATTAYTTAWLNCVIDTDLADLVKMYGKESAKKVWQSGMDAIDLIEKVIKEENIDCDFTRVSSYRYAGSQSEMKVLREEFSLSKEPGFDVLLHDKKTLPFHNEGSLEVRNQAKFHPIKFLMGLRYAAEKAGVKIYENTEAVDMEINSYGKEIIVTKNGKISADYSITTTYQPFKNPKELFAHKGTYISYVYEVHIPHGLIPEGLYEDENNPYHYFRIDEGKNTDRMIVGGEDHRKEIPLLKEKNFRALESFLKKLLPDIRYKIATRWTGPIIETVDGLPYIGTYSEKYPHRFIATGFSGNGMTYSAIAACIISDGILKKHNQYSDLYSAARKTKPYNFMKKFIDFGEEFFGGVLKNLFK